MAGYETPEGKYAMVTSPIEPGSIGEVVVEIRRGTERFNAISHDGSRIDRHERVVVVDYLPPRTVSVCRP